MMALISATEVNSLFLDCLFRSEEIIDGVPNVSPITAEGVRAKIGFHPERLTAAKKQVIQFLSDLDPAFFSGPTGGGGMSFLQMCADRQGAQWAEHRTCDELLCLALALGLAAYCLPRDMWSALPGSMPYIVFDIGDVSA